MTRKQNLSLTKFTYCLFLATFHNLVVSFNLNVVMYNILQLLTNCLINISLNVKRKAITYITICFDYCELVTVSGVHIKENRNSKVSFDIANSIILVKYNKKKS